jgi:hypothetical protein
VAATSTTGRDTLGMQLTLLKCKVYPSQPLSQEAVAVLHTQGIIVVAECGAAGDAARGCRSA